MIKDILKVLGTLLLVLAAWYHDLIAYGIGQGKGQIHILMNARPVEAFLKDPEFPEDLKKKIILIQEVRRFAIDSLGLNNSDNYTTLYDQQGKPILWNVTACPPFELRPKEWTFPFVGNVGYKGFFDYKKAQAEAAKIEAIGYEAQIDEVGGWSTLGWFKDPILSNMLKRSEGSLANLIIHELTHTTLYIKSNVQFNENLATFVGDKGAAIFLKQKFGAESPEYLRYIYTKEDYNKYSQHILKGSNILDSLYKSFTPELDYKTKSALKKEYIQRIVRNIDTISFHLPDFYKNYFSEDSLPNNTYFMSYRRYRADQTEFEKELKEKFNNNFPEYLAYLKKKHGK